MYIVSGGSDALLSFSSETALSLVHISYTVQEAPVTSTVADYVIEYPQLFQGVVLLRNMTVHLHIDALVTLVAQSHRRIPFPLHKQVETELARLLQEDITEPVDGPTSGVSPIVVVSKPHNSQEIRMCVVMRCANQSIARKRYLTPTVDDIIVLLNGVAVFPRLGLRSGYHQIQLDQKFRIITTFSTHVGLFRYKRFNFDIMLEPNVFRRQCDKYSVALEM